MNKSKKISLALIIVGCIIIAAMSFLKFYVLASYSGREVRVNIPGESTVDAVRDSMESAFGSSYGAKVYHLWSLQGGTPAAAHGSYAVKAGESAVTIARKIAKGRQTPIRFTFNNIITFADLSRRAAAVMEFDSIQFSEAADSILHAQGFTPEEYTAAVFPDSYDFYWTASPGKVVNTLLDHRNKFWTPERRQRAAQLNLTPEQVHTLASIVESETNRVDERPSIARLYLNRLDKGMRLQADPTVKFAVGDFGLRRLYEKHVFIDSPYNTYRNFGLPPGPIRIAAASTIDQVLNAPEHDYLFMCAKPDFSGYHNFSRTYDQHRLQAAKYHKALNDRGLR